MDKVKDGYVLGGTASYASKLATVLGFECSVLTSYGDDFLFAEEFKVVDLVRVQSEKSTIFVNSYVGDDRTQQILSQASQLKEVDYLDANLQSSIIHYCPIANEIDFKILQNIPDNVITLATPQGWMRQWDEDGMVSYIKLDWSQLANSDFVIISEEDVENLEDELDEILRHINKLIVTKGSQGADLYAHGVLKHFPSYPTTLLDPTGAGDSFATGFITRYFESKDVEASIIYAHCLSSICVEHVGTNFLDKLDEVDSRVKYYNDHFVRSQP